MTLSGCTQQQMGMHGGVPVEAITLKAEPVAQSKIYQATLISRNSVSLQPQVAGQITDIYVKAGDKVKSGALLMLIDQRKQKATLDSTRADSNAVKSTITQAQDTLHTFEVQRNGLISNLELNKKLYERYNNLYKKGSVSKQDVEKYTDSFTKANSDLDANTAQIQAQRSTIATAKSNYEKSLYSIREQAMELQYYKITAPYSGIIGDIPVKVGSYVLPTSQLISITQNETLEINVGLPVEKIFELHNGLPVEVLDNNNNVAGKSTISFISPRVSTDSQTILVKAILKNPKGILKADQSVKVRVVYNQSPGILVPANSISHLGGQDFAFLIVHKSKQTFVKQQPIKLGDLEGNKYVVLNGLKSGDQIVSEGIQKLMDGVPAMILPKGK